MRKVLIGLTIIIVLLAGQVSAGDWWSFGHHDHERGSGDMETIELDLDSFDQIESSCALDIFVEIGDEQKVSLTIDDNLIDNIEARVFGKTLKLYTLDDYNSRRGGHLEITIPSLEKVEIGGATDIEIVGFNGGSFKYRLSGAGDLTAEGKLDRLKVRISGAGDADTRNLIAQDVVVRVSGSGNARVFAEESFDGTVSGVGSITCWGDPEDIRRNVSGMGKIRMK